MGKRIVQSKSSQCMPLENSKAFTNSRVRSVLSCFILPQLDHTPSELSCTSPRISTLTPALLYVRSAHRQKVSAKFCNKLTNRRLVRMQCVCLEQSKICCLLVIEGVQQTPRAISSRPKGREQQAGAVVPLLSWEYHLLLLSASFVCMLSEVFSSFRCSRQAMLMFCCGQPLTGVLAACCAGVQSPG